jgi:hypothetical protein
MPSPSAALSTQSPDLATFFEYEYSESEPRFIGGQVMPLFTVPKQAGNFGKVTLETLMEHQTSTRRAPTSGYNRRQYEFTEDSYATEEHGIEEYLDDREVQMYSDYIEAQAIATRRAVNSILTAHEKRVSDEIMDVTFYTGDAAFNQALGNGVWTLAASTPIEDIEGAWQKHRNNTGIRPNALILNEYSYRALRNHPDVIARVHSSGAGDQARARDVNLSQLSAVFDIDNIIVGGGMENTSNPNVAASLSDIWPNHALICRVATTNDIREPAIGRTFHWSADGSMSGGSLETYREEAVRSNIVRVRHDVDEKVLYQELGVMIEDVIT